MKTIDINLLGERKAEVSLGLGGLSERLADIDPAVIIILVAGLVLTPTLPIAANVVVDTMLTIPALEEIQRQEGLIKQNEGKGEDLKKLRDEVNKLSEERDQLIGLTSKSGRYVKVFEEVRNLTPTDAWLTSLKVGDTKMELEGEALDYKSVAFFYTNLQNSDVFRQPSLGGLSYLDYPTTGQTVVKFTIQCQLALDGPGG